MIVAEIQITQESFGGRAAIHTIRFDELGKAMAEFDRIAELLKKRGDRSNDLPKLVEIVGAGNQISIGLDRIAALGLMDFEHANREQAGVVDAFPHLFKR